MIIDSHTHCFPDKLAPRAIDTLSRGSNEVAKTDGTLGGLLASMDKYGIAKSFVLNIATNPRQQDNVNKFAAEINNRDGRIFSFGSIHPDCPDVRAAARQIKDVGLYGVKLHPDFMGYDLSSEKFAPIFDACIENDLTVVIHAGIDFVSLDHVHATPEMIAEVIASHPGLRLVCAHFGANFMYEKSFELLCDRDIWIDTAYSSHVMDAEGASKVLSRINPDRVMFATDSPWETPEDTMKFVTSLDMSDEIKSKIFSANAEKLIELSSHF